MVRSLADRTFRLRWELQADGLALTLFLFGVVYRYAVRRDENPMLKQGVVGAFVVAFGLDR